MSIDEQLASTQAALTAMLSAPCTASLSQRDRNLQMQHRLRVRREFNRLYNHGLSDSPLNWLPEAQAIKTLQAIETRARLARDGLLPDTVERA